VEERHFSAMTVGSKVTVEVSAVGGLVGIQPAPKKP
jgi:hypothetical protein